VATGTKRQRIEDAREQSRVARERREAAQKRARILVPVLVTVAVVAIVAIVVAVIALQPKPTPDDRGSIVQPKNMPSDGIVFTGEDGALQVTNAPARTSSTPVPTVWKDSGVDHYVTYVDWSCPNCRIFEQQYSADILKQVAAGEATLEIHPVAILDRGYQLSKYSSRVNTAAVCVAVEAPERFLDAQAALFAAQPSEQSAGLTNAKILSTLSAAGVDPPGLRSCLDSARFTPWLTAATDRAAADQKLVVPGQDAFGTPTVVLNGKLWDLVNVSFGDFVASATVR
jgi:protein-disulfide isomerase